MREERIGTPQILGGGCTSESSLGIDLGTSSVKLLLMTSEGQVLGESSAPYPMHGREQGFYEQKPSQWRQAVLQAAGELRSAVGQEGWGRIGRIGLSAQMPTLVIATPEGELLGDAIVWCDNRAEAVGRELLKLWGTGRHYGKTGVFLDGRYLAPMYVWKKRNQPEALRKEHYILSAKDYLYFWLSGQLATDPSNASGYGVYNLAAGQWDRELCEEAKIPLQLLPEIRDSFDDSASICSAAAEALHLSHSVRIVCGGADSVAGVYGMGGRESGTVCMICGSSTAIVGIRQNIVPVYGNRFFVTPLLQGGSMGMEADLLSTGTAVKWLLELMNGARTWGCPGGMPDRDIPLLTHEDLSQMASEIPAGSEGLFFMPYLSGGEQGVLWDDSLTGGFSGLRLGHGIGHMARACWEGICYESRRCIEAFCEEGVSVKQALLTGPATADPFFMQLMADVLGVPCMACEAVNASAKGAALLALRRQPAPDPEGKLYQPDPRQCKVYTELYGSYIEVSKLVLKERRE